MLVQPEDIPIVDGLIAHQTDLPVGRSGGWPALLVMQGQVILELWEWVVSNGIQVLCLTSTTSESVT